MDTDAWVALGLYRPAAPDAHDRRALLEYLTARGATEEQLVEAQRLGRLPAVAGDLVLGNGSATVSVDELARRHHVAPARVERILLAAGLPVDAQSAVPATLEPLLSAFEAGAQLMGDEAILAFSRVLGAAATNIAEAAVALFYTELGPGSGRQGETELDRARVAEAATTAFSSVPDVLSQVLLVQFDRAGRRVGATRGWSESAVGKPVGPDGPTEIAALGFVDLVGSTAWAEALSLRDHSLALSRFESAAWSSAVLAGGRVVKTIGDEVFFAAPSVDAACRIGLELCRVAQADPLLPPARAAVGHGAVSAREGDYFGPLVNLVSRLVKVAAPGGLVVTEPAAAALTGNGWDLDELDPQLLRGLDHPVRAFAVSPA